MSTIAHYGLIGHPVQHSFSPAMHNAAFRALGIAAQYHCFDVGPEKLKDFILLPDERVSDIQGNVFFTRDIAGFNITIPHKIKAKEIVARNNSFRSENPLYVELSGAINTIKREQEASWYSNTDVYGFGIALRQELGLVSLKGMRIFVIGAGGAGRAAVAYLSDPQQEADTIYIYDIDETVVRSSQEHFFTHCAKAYPYLRKKLVFVSREDIPSVLSSCRLLVNASPVGMKESDALCLEAELLDNNRQLYVYDIVYNRKTQLIRWAEKAGIPACGGLTMLLYQGAYAFRMWTGSQAPVEVMKKALQQEIKKIC